MQSLLLRSWAHQSRRTLSQPRCLAMSAATSSPPPSKRIKMDPNESAATTSYALPSSSVDTKGQGSSAGEKDASMLSVPKPAAQSPSGKAAKSKGKGKNKKQGKRTIKPVESGGLEEIMYYEAIRLLGKDVVEKAVKEETDYRMKFEHLQQVELEVVAMSSHGAYSVRTK